ncbi:MAG: Trk family potassium uptake protein, partial [Ruminococcaceae bacterium]|nr:Trk family potassium uptake protein [Oscillospiraceae bacterium]
MKRVRAISYPAVIALGFFILIMFGTALLALPAASRSGESVGFVDALFTSTSASCVT